MNNACYKMKDCIADLICGTLPQEQKAALEKHLTDCSNCKDYLLSLQDEDKLLDEVFAKINRKLPSLQNKIIAAVNCNRAGIFGNAITAYRIFAAETFAKFAVVAVIVSMMVYFVVTLSWISEIRECIQIAS